MFSVTNYAGFSTPSVTSGGTATPPPTASLNFWLDYSDATKITTSGLSITTATEKSTNAYTGTTVGTDNPQYAAAVQNGLAAAKFPTTFGGKNAFTQFDSATSAGKTIVAVGNFNTTSAVGGRFWLAHNEFGNSAISRNGTSLNFGWNDGSPSISPGTNSVWHLYAFTGMAGSQTGRLDGGVTTATGIGTSTSMSAGAFQAGATSIGAGEAYDAYVGEVRVFTNQLTTTDLFKEEGYLAWKWGLQGNLPSNHPYKNAPP